MELQETITGRDRTSQEEINMYRKSPVSQLHGWKQGQF